MNDMWSKSSSKLYAGVSMESVWRLWSDVNDWSSWHDDLDHVKMSGEFAVGNHFLLKPKGAPEFKIRIVDMEPGRKFTDCTTFFGAKMYDTHELEETESGLRLTNTLRLTGPLAFLWRKLVAENVAGTVPQENDALIARARKTFESAARE
jgi:hypothetical protein